MTTDPTATGEGYEDDNNYGSDLSDDLDDLEGGEELRIDQQTSWLIKVIFSGMSLDAVVTGLFSREMVQSR